MSWSSFIVEAPREPHRTIEEAIKLIGPGSNRHALDIGAGNGRDTRLIASAGFEVVAVDISPASAEALAGIELARYIEADICGFPLGKYSLINASLVFPFIEHSSFSRLWPKLISALIPGGVICGHFFGMQDWKVRSKVAWGVERAAVSELLSTLQVETCDEFSGEGKNQSGEVVIKHNFSFVARVVA